MIVLANARVVTPHGVLNPGWVQVDAGRINYVATGSPPADATDVVDLAGGWLLPGYIDIHVHGGGGHDVTRSPEAMAAAVDYHRGRGTTRTLVSLMAQPVDAMARQLSWVADLTRDGIVAGAHLEGPFLSAARCGAQHPDRLLTPDIPTLHKLLEAGQGAVRTVTVAPELPGALPLITELVERGVVAAVGHTDATFDEAMAGFSAGASLATHLFNAMGSFSQRQPGPAFAALDAGAYVEMINDGIHVHPALTRLVARAAPRSLVFITDAISASGVGDGEYTLGEQIVEVRDGAARLRGGHSLAGSTLTMDEALRRAVQVLGMPIDTASLAASGNAARLLGIDDRTGAIVAGLDADLVVLDTDLSVRRVMIGGSWLRP